MAKLIKRGKNWYSYFKAGGKRIKRSLGADHTAAKIALGRLVEQHQIRHTTTNLFNPSWIAFKAKYLSYRQGVCKPNTVYWDKLAFAHLEKEFPIAKLDQVNPKVLEALQGKLYQTDMSKGAINKISQCIKGSMRKAAEWGHILPQNWLLVKRVKEPEGRLIWYTPEQCQTLLAKCKGIWLTIALLGIRAGLRRSEIAWLTWDDIDFDRDMIRVAGKEGWQTKSGKSRHIPMAPDLKKHLQAIQNGQDFLFAHDDAALWVMSSYFKKIIKKAGLRGSLHALRHTFGSHLVQRGVPLAVVKELMGHADISTTMIYAHLAPENLKSAIGKLPDFGVTVGVTH